uniref:Uncharacterized protein n=1 Tax=Siphoviridae sp. ctedO8 TaxID=2827907 RepID=A0A8S5T2W2_9CAUD|nr:MAG TPA: hypothetical protein [Siphoviridae sp. ctedO8]
MPFGLYGLGRALFWKNHPLSTLTINVQSSITFLLWKE